MARTRIEGRDVMLFNNEGKSFAFCTNSALSINTEMQSISDKDTGVYGKQEPGQITWEITSDHTFDTNDFYTMFDWQKEGSRAKVYFGLKSGYKGSASFDPDAQVNNGTDGNWTPDTTAYSLCGYVYLQSLSVNAASGDKANYSVTLTGDGPLTKVVYSA